MKKSFYKDIKYRLEFLKFELKKIKYRYLINDLKIGKVRRLYFFYKLNCLSKIS